MLAQLGFLPCHLHSRGAAVSLVSYSFTRACKCGPRRFLTAVLLTVHLGGCFAAEMLFLLSGSVTAGSFSRGHRSWAASPHGRPCLASAQGQSRVGLAFRDMSLGAEEFCLIIVIWQQWGHN